MGKRPTKGELPPDWFCQGQTNLLDLIETKEDGDEPDEDPERL